MWQEVLAVDSLLTPLRMATTSSQDSSLYLKRRLQLLSGSSSKVVKKDPSIRKRYISLRVKLLKRQFGFPPDLLSLRNLSLSEGPSSPATSSSSFQHYGHPPPPPPQYGLEYHPGPSTSTSLSQTFKGVHQIYDYHREPVTRIKFGHGGELLISSSLDGTVAIINELHNLKGIPKILRGHGGAGVTSCDISESNEFIVSSGLDGSTILWDTFTGKQLRKVNENRGNYVSAVRFLPRNNNFILCVLNSGSVQIMNISTGKYVSSSPIIGKPISIEINQMGSLLWVGNESGIIESFKLDANLGKIAKGSRLHLNTSSITSISARTCITSLTRDPCLLVNQSNSDSVYLYRIVDDFGTIVPFKTYSGESKSSIKCSSFAPIISYRSGTIVASGSEDGLLSLFDLERSDKHCISKLHGHLKPVIGICFSHDEAYLATADFSGQIIVWKK